MTAVDCTPYPVAVADLAAEVDLWHENTYAPRWLVALAHEHGAGPSPRDYVRTILRDSLRFNLDPTMCETTEHPALFAWPATIAESLAYRVAELLAVGHDRADVDEALSELAPVYSTARAVVDSVRPALLRCSDTLAALARTLEVE